MQVDFYVLPTSQVAARYHFACRLAETAWRHRHRVHLHVESADIAQQLDQLLWGFRADAFLPHRLAAEAGPEAPVLIGWQPEHATAPEGLLINLAAPVPACAPRFPRVAEIVVQSPAILASTREHWRWYQQQGHRPTKHDIEP